MVDYDKVQSRIFKKASKDILSVRRSYHWNENRDSVDIIGNSFVLRIPKALVLLDLKGILGDKASLSLDKILRDIETDNDLEELRITNCLERIRVNSEEKLLVKLTGERNGDIWIDEEYLLLFSKYYQFDFRYKGKQKSPVAVYQGDTCVGVILPVQKG